MKKFIFAAAACAALLSVSCTKESGVPAGKQATTFEASLSPLTKTAIDGAKVSWVEGDAITVNGVGSASLSQGGATASFTMTSEVAAPYSAIYPPILYYGDDIVDLSSVMYLEQCTSIPLAAYSESGTSLSFSPLTAILKIPVTGEQGVLLSTVTLKGNADEQVSGPFAIDYTVPELIGGLDGTYKTVTVDCENAALSSTPLDIYIPVPAGSYESGLQVEFKTSDGITVTKGTGARTLAAGELRSMPAVNLSASAPKGIFTADDLAAFAEAVNSGAEDLSQWQNEAGEIALMADIDMSSFSEWTPIGYPATKAANGANESSPEGNVFSGIFNGGGHTIKNFKPTVLVPDNNTWGLFGVLKMATVKDLNINCEIVVSAAKKADAGVVAGTMICSTISNVTVNGTLSTNGSNTDNQRFSLGGIAGYLAGENENGGSSITNCEVNLTVSGKSGKNTKNGATSMMVGGIAGYATTNANSTATNYIEDCTFLGALNVDAGRCAGILATAFYNTTLRHCVNKGSMNNGFTNGREAGVVSQVEENCAVINCENRGDLTVTHNLTRVGGIFCLLNKASCYVENGGNYGTIISPNEDSNGYCSGLLGGWIKGDGFDHISGVTISGKIGKSATELFDVNADNFMQYIGHLANGAEDKITGLTYVAP